MVRFAGHHPGDDLQCRSVWALEIGRFTNIYKKEIRVSIIVFRIKELKHYNQDSITTERIRQVSCIHKDPHDQYNRALACYYSKYMLL